jgi:polyketide synthase Type III
MFVNAVGTANPPNRYDKAQCWDAFTESEWFGKLDRRSHLVAQAVLGKDNGIQTRSLALDTIEDAFRIDPDTLHARYLANAPVLVEQAGARALAACGLDAREIDAVVISSCTGYLCPGLTSYAIESLGLREDVVALDLVGQGCAAALPNWRAAAALIGDGSCEHVLSICVEVSSAAMYLDDDPGVLVSACLFGDGAGAAVLSREPMPGRRRIEWSRFGSMTNPAERNALLFESRGGMLRNILTLPVPRLAGEHAARLLQRVLGEQGLQASDIAAWIVHAGGRDVLLALQKEIGLGAEDLRYSARMLREYGNMSSAFVYFVLADALADEAPGGWWWLTSFGAGFTCHGALLEVA